ncbi:VWA domain-containing protein [Moritella dasanensis]|uniref:VWA domain-containing protein n=1 Tax=Moritella dasanensis TaxID=428031 RepID=UPI00030BFEC6|nr:VWA domain-containing protein [Moritella dasanensis]
MIDLSRNIKKNTNKNDEIVEEYTIDLVKRNTKNSTNKTASAPITLKKSIVDLTKKAKAEIDKQGLGTTKSQVVLVLDISKSMNRLFKSGVMQELIERILGLAINFDDDGCIDLMLFGTRAYQLPNVSVDDLDCYVEREILANYSIIEATRYATALEMIKNKYQGNSAEPVFVIFITDGNNSDKKESTDLITNLSKESIFFQFIGIGKESFPYLMKLDDLPNRYLDNAGFAHINDIASIDDSALYSRLLNEYPDWIKSASEKGMI